MSKHSTENGKPAKRLQRRINSYEESMAGRGGSYPQSMNIKNTLRKPGSLKK
jgi:hypothetical protein